MCGLGLISLSEASKVHPRKLAHALLTELEWRGTMASGWAFGRPDAGPRYGKAATNGGNLDVSRIPAHARNLILHTRLATHGSEHDNRNNHPVLSPEGKIALVHNGVIWNHDEVRRESLPGVQLPEVDTAVAPALIERYGVEGLEKIAGDAAVIWLNRDTGDTIHLARVESSPFILAKMSDGSMVGASTWQILTDALEDFPEFEIIDIEQVSELQYYQILNGLIIEDRTLNEPVGFRYGYAASFRDATSGGHGSPRIGASFGVPSGWWDEDEYEAFQQAASDWEDPDDDIWNYEMKKQMEDFTSGTFFVTDFEGDTEYFQTLEEMLDHIGFYADKAVDDPYFPNIDDESGWINHFCDLGEVTYGGHEISWVAFPEDMDQYQVGWAIRDGVTILKRYA